MATTSSGNVGRSNLPYKSASQLVAWETDPTPVVTRSSEVSRVEPTSSMVLRSHTHTRGGRSSAAISDVEMRPETDIRPESEINNPAEIQVSMSAIYEEGLGATELYIPETAGQYVTADKPDTTDAFPVSQEIVPNSNPNLTPNINPRAHTCQLDDIGWLNCKCCLDPVHSARFAHAGKHQGW